MNRYSKLIKTLKEAPTNSMGGLYAVNPPGFRVSGRDREKRFLPDIDGNFTDGIPGNPGDPFYLRPEGYWNGGNDWQTEQIPDATQDYLIDDPTGKSTGDLIAEDGTVKTFLPPNSRHFILGPLVDGYVQNHGYDNYSNIGYLQKDTRQFVLLARIQGQFTADLHQEGARVWDGTEGQLTIFNSNFTLAMAEWFRDQVTAGTFTENVPYFYSGGVPQQPISGGPSCPNCAPNMFGGVGAGTPKAGGGFGQGGPGPKLGSPQGPPNATGPDGAGYPWGPSPTQTGPTSETSTNNKPKGSLLAGFAAIDGAYTSSLGVEALALGFAGVAWLGTQLYNALASVVGGLISSYTWTPEEERALNAYASQKAQQGSQTMSAELSNEQWERQAEAGRLQDQADAKEANERVERTEEQVKEAKTPEQKARAEEALENALKNKKRVTDNNTRNRQQRSKERRARGLNNPGGIQGGGELGMYNSYTPALKSVQKIIFEQEGVTSGAASGGGSEPISAEPESNFGGGGRVEYTTSLNGTISRLKGNSLHFVSGYVSGSVESGPEALDAITRGTNLSQSTIKSMASDIDSQWKEMESLSDKYLEVSNRNRPKIDSLLARAYAAPDTNEGLYGIYLPLMRRVDALYAESEAVFQQQIRAAAKWHSLNRRLGSYVINGRILTRQEIDPFSLDDPNVGSEKNAKDKDKQIQDQINILMQENDELEQAQALNKLKALGWGALMAGGIIVGAAVLAKPAIVGALGLGLVRTLKGLIRTAPKSKPPIKYPSSQPKPDSGTGPWTSSSYNPNKPGGGPGRKRFPVGDSYEPNSRKKLLSEIRKPVQIKEGPTKYKMNFAGRYSSQNTPDKTGSNISDDLTMKANARGQRWRAEDKYWSGYETTEKMNIIQDRTGHGQQAWDHIVNENANKKDWRDAEIQEKLNMIAHERAMLKENPDFSSPFGNVDVSPTTTKNKKNFDKVNKIKRVMADKNTEKLMSQIAPEYPSNAVPQPDEVTNLHPKLQSGENASAYYKRLDPISADSMPDAAYPQIDNLRDNARKKRK